MRLIVARVAQADHVPRTPQLAERIGPGDHMMHRGCRSPAQPTHTMISLDHR